MRSRAATHFTVAGTLDNHGVLQGEGTITAANIINHGVVAPGQSPGTLTLAAAFVQASDGRLAIELASTASFDSLVVSGTSALGGTLELSAYGGYVPTVGDSFLILTSTGALSGSFSGSPLLFGFAPGVAFGVAYDYAAHTVRLNVLAVPEPATLALWLFGIGLIGLIGLNGAAGGDRRDRHP